MNRRLPQPVLVLLGSGRGRVALLGMSALLLVAVLSPPLLDHAAQTFNFGAISQGPSKAHLLGTDPLGRDIAARALTATRLSLILAVSAGSMAAVIGTLFGALAALLPSRARGVASRFVDALLAFPDLLIAIFIVAIVGVGQVVAVIAVGVANAPFFARVALTLTSSVAGRDYLASARVLGVPKWRLLLRHVVPNIADTLFVTSFLAFSYSLIAIASLSFLGLGVQEPSYDWGLLLTNGIKDFYETPLESLAPAFMLVITGLCFTYLGEALARAMNPRLWTSIQRARTHRNRWRQIAHRVRESEARPTVRELGEPIEPGEGDGKEAVLDMRDLRVSFQTPEGQVAAVDGVSLRIARGEVVGIVGESGSGKSLTALAIGCLIGSSATVEVQRLDLDGHSLLDKDLGAGRRSLLKGGVAYVFQDPSASLNPALRIGEHLREASDGKKVTRAQASSRAEESMREVAVSMPRARLAQYPHELSGGISQRVTIAMALLAHPRLIVADEPTTALDVTVQAQVLEVLRQVNRTHGTAILLISHSIPVVASICDRVIVMYAGHVVEEAAVDDLIDHAVHPYTRALLAAVPTLEADRSAPLVSIDGPRGTRRGRGGCPFVARCPERMEICTTERPELRHVSRHQTAACWLIEIPSPR